MSVNPAQDGVREPPESHSLLEGHSLDWKPEAGAVILGLEIVSLPFSVEVVHSAERSKPGVEGKVSENPAPITVIGMVVIVCFLKQKLLKGTNAITWLTASQVAYLAEHPSHPIAKFYT